MKCIFKPVNSIGLVQFQPAGIGQKTATNNNHINKKGNKKLWQREDMKQSI